MTKKTGRLTGPPRKFDFGVGISLRHAVCSLNSGTLEGRKLIVSFLQESVGYDLTPAGSLIVSLDLWPRIEAQIRAGAALASGRRALTLEREFIPAAVFYQTTPDLELNTVSTPDGLVFFDVRLTRVKAKQEPTGAKRLGRPPVKVEQIAAAMRAQIASGDCTLSEFEAMKADAMATLFNASRNTCKAALEAVKKSAGNY